MKLSKAVDLLLSAKSKRKGIDKDTKNDIKRLEKDGNFDKDMLSNAYHLEITGEAILGMKENDFFDPKKIGRLFLESAINLSKDNLQFDIYKSVIKTSYREYGDSSYGGLGDKKWALELLDFALKNIEMVGADLLELAYFMNSEVGDREKAKELALQAVTKASNKGQISDIVDFLAFTLDEVDISKKILEDAKNNNNIPYYNDDKSDLDWISNELK